MRTINKVAVVTMVVTACIMLTLLLLEERYWILDITQLSDINDSSRQGSIAQIDSDGKQNSSMDTQINWPMFRGGRGLLGRASGTLPDSLELAWKFKAERAIKSSPVIYGDLVFVGSNDDNVYAIDLEKGNRVWAYKTGDSVEATPCVVGDTVYVGSLDGFLYAIDAKSGSLKWKYETDGEIPGAANWTLSPDGQTIWILVGSYDNILHCVNSTNGKVVWTYESGYYINGSPAVEGSRAVFGGCDEVIHVVSLVDGSVEAKIEGGSYIAASAAILDGQVYVGNYDNIFIKADIATKKILWKYTESEDAFFSSPAVGQEKIIVGGRDELVHCISRSDGKRLWAFQTLGEVDSSPVICGDKVIFGSSDGIIYMIRLLDGSKVWSYEIGQAIISSPAVARGKVIIGCDDGYLYAFSVRNP